METYQWNNVVVKETKFAFVPKLSWVLSHPSLNVRVAHLVEKTLILTNANKRKHSMCNEFGDDTR